ncbi:MAG: hypothetical protein U0U69_14535 [Acidimicrobiia bacterium]
MQHVNPRMRTAAMPSLFALAMMAAIVGLLAVATWLAFNRSYSVAVAMLGAPAIIAISIPLLRKAQRLEPSSTMRQIIFWGLVLKVLGAFGRYGMAYILYAEGDAATYDLWGRDISAILRSGSFHIDTGTPSIVGTGFVRLLTGIVYTFIGPSQMAGFLVFAWLGFWGLFFFYRAYRVTFPDANPLLYGCLIFFVPSMFFWPSSIGKEAWVLFTLGLATLGCAKLFRSKLSGFWQAAAGTLGVALVRPHIAVILVVSMVVGYALGRVESSGGKRMNPVVKAVVVVVLVGGALLTANNAAKYFGVEDASLESATAVTAEANRRTTQGGSEFAAPNPQSPAGFPLAALTVLYRPFVFEAHNLQGLITAAEASAFLVLTLVALPRILRNLGQLRRNGFLLACIAYILLYTYFFGSIGNFGILARQRIQVLPFLFAVIAMPVSRVYAERSEVQVRRETETLPAVGLPDD